MLLYFGTLQCRRPFVGQELVCQGDQLGPLLHTTFSANLVWPLPSGFMTWIAVSPSW